MHDSEEKHDDSEAWTYFPWTHAGLYLFDITTAAGEEGIDKTGSIIVAESASTNLWFNRDGNDRSVISGNTVHYIHANQVWSSSRDGGGAAVHGPE